MNAYPSKVKSYQIQSVSPEGKRTVLQSGISRGALWKLLDEFHKRYQDSPVRIQFAVDPVA